jgi:hypothetical protein
MFFVSFDNHVEIDTTSSSYRFFEKLTEPEKTKNVLRKNYGNINQSIN